MAISPHPQSSRRAVVVGGSGTIGLPLGRRLASDGWHVSAVARFREPAERRAAEAAGLEPHPFELTRDDPADLPEAEALFLEVWDPNHLLGPEPDVEAIWRLNHEAVGRLVARYAGTATLVNGSTGSLYGPRGDRPSRETDRPRPADEYGLARFAGERLIDFLAAPHRRPVIHLRTYHAHTGAQGLARRVADAVLAGRGLGPHPDERVQLIGLGDVVRMTAAAVGEAAFPPRVVNLCHGRCWRMAELAERLRALMGRGEVRFDRQAGGAEASIWGDAERMTQMFGPPEEDPDTLVEAAARAAVEAAGS